MQFKSWKDCIEYYDRIDFNKSDFVLLDEGKDEEADCLCKAGPAKSCGCNNAIDEANVSIMSKESLLIESLTGSPEMKMVVAQAASENTFYVKGFQAVKDACGTGRITLSDRTSHMNMCEMDGNCTVKLNIVVEGAHLSNIPFVLRVTEDEPYMMVRKEHLV